MVSDMMTAEQLKSSILQLAMQGKLVEQRPEEGTGEELYKEIVKERQRLVKEGRIKKDKEQSEKNEEPPFDIPESWQWAKLNDIVAKTIKRGKSPKYVQKSNTLVFAQKCNTKAGFIDISLCLFLDEKQLSKYPDDEFMLNEDIVINSTGNGTLGRVGIYRDSDNPNKLPLVPDSHVTVIRCSRLMDVGYVFYCLKYYQPYMEKLGSGSTNQTELGAGVLKDLSFPLPPLAEQKRIVAKIEELMPFVEQYAAASTKLNTLNASFPETMKKSILQEAVQGKLVPQDPNDEPASLLLKKIAEEKKRLIKEGKIKKQKPLPEITEDEIPFDIPESWEWIRIGMVTDVKGGKRVPKGKSVIDSPTPHIYIRVTDMKNQTIVSDKLKYITEDVYQEIKQYTINKEDLYLTIAGTIGAVGVVPDMFDGMNLTENAVKLCNILIYKDYLLRVIQSPLVQAQFVDRTNKVAQPKLAIVRIESTLIPLPPLEEQKRIVEMIDKLLLFIDGLDG